MRHPKSIRSTTRLTMMIFASVSFTAQAAHAQFSDGRYEPPSYNDGRSHDEKEEKTFGKFSVLRYVEDNRQTPIPDVSSIIMESSLKWHDSSNRVDLKFKDNGYSVSFQAQERSADGKAVCIVGDGLVAYDTKPSVIANWKGLEPFIRQQIKKCSTISSADFIRIMTEIQTSSSDYAVAANYWKSVSAGLFGPSGRRCIVERMVKRVLPPQFECTSYSKP